MYRYGWVRCLNSSSHQSRIRIALHSSLSHADLRSMCHVIKYSAANIGVSVFTLFRFFNDILFDFSLISMTLSLLALWMI